MAGLPARLQFSATRYARRAAAFLFALPPYRLTLIGRRPRAFRMALTEPWPGDAGRGQAVVTGQLVAPALGTDPLHRDWHPAGASQAWLCTAHGFEWLRDLRELGGGDARRAARDIVADWTAQHRRWSLPAWRADVTGRRLAAWLAHYEALFASGDDSFRDLIAGSIVLQLRHLERVWCLETRGAARIAALKGIIYCALCFGRETLIDGWVRRLVDEVDRQVLPDGGHVQRNPSVLFVVLRDLLDLRAALTQGKREIPASLQQAIDRIGPMIQFLRLGDGGLARFNGAWSEDRRLVDMVVDQANARGKSASRAPAMGFERLAAGDLVAIVDAAGPPRSPFDEGAHAGTLSLEISAGGNLLIVNCGASRTATDAWSLAQRATAAHSTVVVAERNSSQLLPDGHLGKRRAAATTRRTTADGGQLLTLSHDGYLRSDGIVHRRRLYLADDGADLRGEDMLTGRAGVPYAVRFHLHPSVNVSLIQDGHAALLKPQKGGGWRLRASEPMELTESVFFEGVPEPKRSSQVVVSGITGTGDTTVKWALRRERSGV